MVKQNQAIRIVCDGYQGVSFLRKIMLILLLSQLVKKLCQLVNQSNLILITWGLHHTLKNVTYSLKKQKGQTLDYVNMMKKGY